MGCGHTRVLCLVYASRELPEFLDSLWVQSDSALELYEVFWKILLEGSRELGNRPCLLTLFPGTGLGDKGGVQGDSPADRTLQSMPPCCWSAEVAAAAALFAY